jgi:hypothetical protein
MGRDLRMVEKDGQYKTQATLLRHEQKTELQFM